MIFRVTLAAVALAFAVTAVVAQTDPIAARKALMKANGQQVGVGVKMVKGEEPFDLEKTKKIFAVWDEAAQKMPALFPESSKTGGDTIAAPKIWEDPAGFKAAFAKFDADIKAAQASVKDLDSFKAAFGNVTKNCASCHETYRLKRS